MKIVILHNSPAPDASLADQDVLVQRDAVTASLRRLGHEVDSLPCSLDLSEAMGSLNRLRPGVVFNLVESLEGTDRLMAVAPLLLDALGIPYTGAPTRAMMATSDKIAAKRTLRNAGLPTAPWLTLNDAAWHGEPASCFAKVIVKAVWEHASFEMTDDAVVDRPGDPAEMVGVLRERERASGRPYFAEGFVDGREFNLTVLAGPGGPTVLPPAEIVFTGFPPDKPRIVGQLAKWNEESFEYRNTNRTFEFPEANRPLLDRLTRLARECWLSFQLRGYARVDFRIDHDGRPWILEVNVNPCISPDAGFSAAVEHAGIGYDEAIRRIVDDALAGGPPSRE